MDKDNQNVTDPTVKTDSGITAPQAGGTQSFKEQIENNLIIFFCGTIITGFITGIGAYKGILTIAELETINKKDKAEYEILKKNPVTQTNTSAERVIPPNDLTPNVLENKPVWVDVLVSLFSTEGAYKQNKAPNNETNFHYGSEAVQYEFTQPYKEFNWTLDTVDSYQITGQGFLVNSTDDLVQPLKFSISESNDRITFHVPESNKGDKLIAVLMVESPKPFQLKDITSAFRSSSK